MFFFMFSIPLFQIVEVGFNNYWINSLFLESRSAFRLKYFSTCKERKLKCVTKHLNAGMGVFMGIFSLGKHGNYSTTRPAWCIHTCFKIGGYVYVYTVSYIWAFICSTYPNSFIIHQDKWRIIVSVSLDSIGSNNGLSLIWRQSFF